MNKLILILLSITLICTINPKLFAHPHVFIENKVTFKFDQNGLSSILFTWFFDAMFSSVIINDYDKDQDGSFNAAEIGIIKDEAFSNLKDFHYLTYINIDNKPFEFKYIKNFKAGKKGNNVFYTFEIPCHVKALTDFSEVRLTQQDKTFFIDVSYVDEKPIAFLNQENYAARAFIKDNSEAYFKEKCEFLEETVLKFKKKS